MERILTSFIYGLFTAVGLILLALLVYTAIVKPFIVLVVILLFVIFFGIGWVITGKVEKKNVEKTI